MLAHVPPLLLVALGQVTLLLSFLKSLHLLISDLSPWPELTLALIFLFKLTLHRSLILMVLLLSSLAATTLGFVRSLTLLSGLLLHFLKYSLLLFLGHPLELLHRVHIFWRLVRTAHK